jgi:hypothetical protein
VFKKVIGIGLLCLFAVCVFGSPTVLADTISSKPISVIFYITAKATPIITWNNPANIVYGTPLSSVQLDATASVPRTILSVGTHTLGC